MSQNNDQVLLEDCSDVDYKKNGLYGEEEDEEEDAPRTYLEDEVELFLLLFPVKYFLINNHLTNNKCTKTTTLIFFVHLRK